MEEQQDSASTSGVHVQCHYNIAATLRQYYSEFLVDSAEMIGTLLSRLEMPELPVEGNEGTAVKEEEMEKPKE